MPICNQFRINKSYRFLFVPPSQILPMESGGLGPESYQFAIPGITNREVTDTVTDLKLFGIS